MVDVELEINPEIICFIINGAHEFHAKEAVVIPEEPPGFGEDDDWSRQLLADHEDDLTFQELHSTINDLEPDQQAMVVALMWLGRGDYELDEWDEAVKEAQDSWTPRTAEYLLATPMVADYLQEGLAALGHSCND